MLKTLLTGCLLVGATAALHAGPGQMQGVIVDWRCAKSMAQNGREKVLHNQHNCSLVHNYSRQAYGLITSDNKYYRLDDPGNSKVMQMLKDTPDKDSLKVVVTGDIQGGTIKVQTISEL